MWERLSTWTQRAGEIALLGLLGLLWVFDTILTTAPADTTGALVCVVGGGVGILAVVLRKRRTWLVAVALSAASLVLSAVVAGAPDLRAVGFTEAGAFMVLTITVLRRVEPIRNAVVLSVGILVVLISLPALRFEGPENGYANAATQAATIVYLLGWSVGAGIGGYLRVQQERRKIGEERVRRGERLELARELHDLVAHHITGIVVQAQAARTVGETNPEAVLPALDAIAGAGSEALTSMRRLVGVLRADDHATRNVGVTLDDLRKMVGQFSPAATFDLGPGVSSLTLAPEVLTTLHRVLTESLTNIRRHAPHTPWVEVRLTTFEDSVRLRVANPLSAADPRLSRLGGGFGLIGMAERVETMGGHLVAGPVAGHLWEVAAELPLPAR
ncbi:histidine kinase [Herbidospora sp. NBRC 101105]|uniref:sensor histidine kinase n=1 Tax=Herbidospora sp. NBRC 101105 TaxID=3032195 RepID=UPI0024A4493C|nr:histidine kinase [Herbidospora sp. NBRC 101105]GLX98843.1 two-component sensor histidine kinase [Herbidospora sp. NBRC 101105]